MKGFIGVSAITAGVDETGTAALGISGSGFATYVERPPGLAEWNSAGVVKTNITGAPSSTRWALSPSGAALVVWGEKATPMVAYKPAGGSFGAAVALDSVNSFDLPIPLLDEAGHAAVVWTRKAGTPTLNMPDQIVASSPTGTSWPAAPTKLADITTPEPEIGNPDDGYDFSGCPVELHAAILPGGTPVASWNDAYGSWKQTGAGGSEFEIALCGVRVARRRLGRRRDPATRYRLVRHPGRQHAELGPASLVASGTDSKTAIVLRGREDSVQIGGCAGEVDACVNQERESRVALGTGTGLAVAGSNLLGVNENTEVALRNGRTLVLSDGQSTVARAGVGVGFPTLTPLPTDFALVSAGLSLNDAGAAHIGAISDNITTVGLRLFDAPAGGPFAGPQVVDGSSGANRTPSLALDCKGLPVMAWSLGSGTAYSSNFDTAPSICGSGPRTGTGSGSGKPGPGESRRGRGRGAPERTDGDQHAAAGSLLAGDDRRAEGGSQWQQGRLQNHLLAADRQRLRRQNRDHQDRRPEQGPNREEGSQARFTQVLRPQARQVEDPQGSPRQVGQEGPRRRQVDQGPDHRHRQRRRRQRPRHDQADDPEASRLGKLDPELLAGLRVRGNVAAKFAQ